MQGEKEMKGKVLTELEGGERRTDGWTDGLTDRLTTDIQTDQTDRLQEFHMLYKTKNFFQLNLLLLFIIK